MEETGRPLYGEAFEEFVTSMYLMAVRSGTPTRDVIRRSVEGIDPRDVDHAVGELLARGFLKEEGGTLTVVPPREAVARYAEATEMRLRMARATAPELESAWRKALGRGTAPIMSGIDLLQGVDDIGGRISALHLAARDRLWWSLDGSPACRMLLEQAAQEPEILDVRGGVVHRLVLDASLLELPAAVTVMTVRAARGASVRTGSGVPLSAVVCDDEAAVLDLSRFDLHGMGSVEVREPGPVIAVGSVLDRMWRLAAPFGEPAASTSGPSGLDDPRGGIDDGGSDTGPDPPGVPGPLDERDQAVLGLLAAGASDQAIARNLGVSVRTVERRVRHLMEHLGAATRFHAGAQAVRRGWV